MDSAIAELINTVKSLTPVLWGIALKQVQVEMATQIVWVVVVGVLIALVVKLCLWANAEYDEYDKSMVLTLCAILIAAMATVFIGLVCAVIGRVINPEWYAIQILLSAVR